MTTILYYDATTRLVIRGPRTGQPIRSAYVREVLALLQPGQHARCCWTTLRPWWRLWQRTPAVVITQEASP